MHSQVAKPSCKAKLQSQVQITKIIAQVKPSVIISVIARGKAEFNNFCDRILSRSISVLCHVIASAVSKNIE